MKSIASSPELWRKTPMDRSSSNANIATSAGDFSAISLGRLTLFTLSLLCLGPFLLAPPLQTPDENAHLIRAYLVGQGYVLLKNQAGHSSGGFVDTSLEDYISIYAALPFKRARAITRSEVQQARALRWSKSARFCDTPSTAIYFPIFYVPQAIGLRIGEVAGWTVESSYTLARLLTLTTCLLLLHVGFYCHPPSWAVSGLLLLPMITFLMASPHPEGLANAGLVALLGYVTGRIRRCEATLPATVAIVSTGAAILAVYRAQLAAPLVFLPLLLPPGTSRGYRWAGVCAAAAFVVCWLWMTLSLVVDIRTHDYVAGSVRNNAAYLLSHPLVFVSLFFNTVTSGGWLVRTAGSFIGYLGWGDAPLAPWAYGTLLTSMTLLVFCQIIPRDFWTMSNWWRAALVLGGGLSVLAVFPILALAVGDVTDKTHIMGIQGRYFIAPAMMMLYGLTDRLAARSALLQRVLLTSWAVLVLTSQAATIAALLDRYYLR